MEKEYAQALFELAQKPGASADALVKQLVKHLKETGREKLLPRILREFKRIDARSESFGELLEVASEQEVAAAQKEAKELGITATAQVNPDLVTGWRARKASRLIDRSGKRALVDLYRQIATNA
jgi:F0F1-type ATP synthase delta subunit